mgnify:CR=1 FL=1
MHEGIQKDLFYLGKYGCYFLSILKLCERFNEAPIEPIQAYRECFHEGLISADCYVRNPEKIMSKYTSYNWEVYKTIPGDVFGAVVERWSRKGTMVEEAHFKLPDWDPWGGSDTVKYGYLESLRVFRRG